MVTIIRDITEKAILVNLLSVERISKYTNHIQMKYVKELYSTKTKLNPGSISIIDTMDGFVTNLICYDNHKDKRVNTKLFNLCMDKLKILTSNDQKILFPYDFIMDNKLMEYIEEWGYNREVVLYKTVNWAY